MTLKQFLEFLEGLGLILALLDFTGWSARLQSWINTHRFAFFQWLRAKRNEQMAERVALVPLVLLILGVFYVAYIGITQPTNFVNTFQSYLALFTIPIAIFLFFFVCLPLVYNFLLLINKPPSGTVGTISLVTALSSFALQRIGWLANAICKLFHMHCA